MPPSTILLVDDDPVSLRLLKKLLTEDGYRLEEAHNGEDAIALVRAKPQTYDLVLLDVHMPGTDGIEVCRRLKNDPGSMAIPIVLISGVRTGEESIQEGLNAGADGYLVKPIEDIAVRAWVRATLRISHLRHLLEQRGTNVPESAEEVFGAFAKLSHAVSNPLQALYAAADILALQLPDEADARDLITEILAQAERASEIVANASLMARQHLAEPEQNA